MNEPIRTGDLVKARRFGNDEINRLRRWGRIGLFGRVGDSGIPLSWPSDKEKIWLVIDDVCPDMISFTQIHAISEFLGRRFYRCVSASGDVRVLPDFTIEKM